MIREKKTIIVGSGIKGNTRHGSQLSKPSPYHHSLKFLWMRFKVFFENVRNNCFHFYILTCVCQIETRNYYE